jgi:predicted transport protein
MPQNDRLSKVWKAALGPEWKRIHETWLHTPGNLTLTGYNPEYSDKPFLEKRDMTGGFKESHLRLNKGLAELDTWNEETIKDRVAKLAKTARKVWTVPSLSEEVLASYKPSPEPAAYVIENHPYLLKSPGKELFDALRKEVFAIDAAITEEFLKVRVTYKAESTFVDVVPQAKRLLLFLNLKIHDLQDPKGIATDMTGKGHWGSGDVQVPLESLDEVPYVMGLIRQAFEVQMGAVAGG